MEDQQVDIYDIYDFPYEEFEGCSTVELSKRSTRKYVEAVACFDTETTSIRKEYCNIFGSDFGFMYVWQFCIDMVVCCGRTWKEWLEFTDLLCEHIDCSGRKLVIYVHNLSFEFQFMRNYIDVETIFCRDKRDVVYFTTKNIEYRCSYALSNMSLKKFLEKSKGVTFGKQSGDEFDYSKLRFPDTELVEHEWGYSVCDVLGLCQAITYLLKDDTLCTIPLTSTGYVRRDFRTAMKKNPKHRDYMKKLALNKHTYLLAREASRGAISGSNHVYTEEILEEVDSEDIKSSYPYQMMTKYFPMSRFIQYNCKKVDSKFIELIDNFCCIIVWSCSNLKVKEWSGIPYISKAKCRAIKGAKCGNGKVYSAERIGMCTTEIDFKIIREHYYFENVVIHEIHCAQRGMLPKSFREVLGHMFQMKTDLEDGDKFLYAKYKNKINAAFGMMLTDILHGNIVYKQNCIDCWVEEEVEDIEKALSDYYNSTNSFLHYQHGIWVLAHGRDDLVKGMDVVGRDIVQVDTDSVKHVDDHIGGFIKLNDGIIAKADSYDVKPYSMKDEKKHYLGVWEHEGDDGKTTYYKFKTLGAKKYCDEDENGKMSITVAGLSKNANEFFEKKSGLESFSTGTYVGDKYSGRTCAVYNDFDRVYDIVIDGHNINLGSNIAVNNIGYTLSMSNEWLMMCLDGKMSVEERVAWNGAFKNYG